MKYSVQCNFAEIMANTVEVEADSVSEACEKAIEASDNNEGWSRLDCAGETFVGFVSTTPGDPCDGETQQQIPHPYTEVAIFANEEGGTRHEPRVLYEVWEGVVDDQGKFERTGLLASDEQQHNAENDASELGVPEGRRQVVEVRMIEVSRRVVRGVDERTKLPLGDDFEEAIQELEEAGIAERVEPHEGRAGSQRKPEADIEHDHVTPQELLERHVPKMVEVLKNATADRQGSPTIRAFCDLVADDLDRVADDPSRRDYLPGEDVFLWCHNELTELAEIERPAPARDPYLKDMLARLRDFGGRLERKEPLPPGFAIHWLDDAGTEPDGAGTCGCDQP